MEGRSICADLSPAGNSRPLEIDTGPKDTANQINMMPHQLNELIAPEEAPKAGSAGLVIGSALKMR